MGRRSLTSGPRFEREADGSGSEFAWIYDFGLVNPPLVCEIEQVEACSKALRLCCWRDPSNPTASTPGGRDGRPEPAPDHRAPRAYATYLRQTATSFSSAYIADVLNSHTDIARLPGPALRIAVRPAVARGLRRTVRGDHRGDPRRARPGSTTSTPTQSRSSSPRRAPTTSRTAAPSPTLSWTGTYPRDARSRGLETFVCACHLRVLAGAWLGPNRRTTAPKSWASSKRRRSRTPSSCLVVPKRRVRLQAAAQRRPRRAGGSRGLLQAVHRRPARGQPRQRMSATPRTWSLRRRRLLPGSAEAHQLR